MVVGPHGCKRAGREMIRKVYRSLQQDGGISNKRFLSIGGSAFPMIMSCTGLRRGAGLAGK